MVLFSNNYTWCNPTYNYPCEGFRYSFMDRDEWFVMDDYGNAVRSVVEESVEFCCGEH